MKPEDLKINKRRNRYVIKCGRNLLRTPNGFVIESPTVGLMERIIADFEGQGDLVIEDGIVIEPRVLSAYCLASTKRDFMDEGDDLGQLPGWVSSDPIFEPTAGHPIVSIYQVEAQSKIESFSQTYGLTIQPWHNYTREEKIKMIEIIQNAVNSFTPYQISALINLSWPCGGHFVNSTVYLLGLCDEREWATVVFSRTPDVCRIVGEVPAGSYFSVKDDSSEDEQRSMIENIVKYYEDDCFLVKRYLEATREA